MPKKRVENNVREILKNYSETRGNDQLLCTYYWFIYDEVEFTGVKNFAKTFQNATSSETITRTRRRIQYGNHEQERFLPDDKITSARLQRAQQFRNELGGASNDG